MSISRHGSIRLSFARSAVLAVVIALAAWPPQVTAIAGEPPAGLADLIPRLLPAVVNISSDAVVEPPAVASARAGAPAASSRWFLGSGFIVDPSGIIVTNHHVVANSFDIIVTFQDNTQLTAELIAASALADIALLRVHSAKPLAAVSFGDSTKVRIGDPVFAIGDPLGLGGSVTAGIVSQLNRNIMLTPYDDYIQTDAAINHGNSGGPLFDMQGEVIGIATALWAPTGETGSVGLGFAIPSHIAQFVVRQLRENGRLRIGWLDAHLQAVTGDIATALGLPEVEGALVDDVTSGGPAAQAGLRQGDVIVAAGGRHLPDSRAVARAIAEAPIGHIVDLGVWRDGKLQDVLVTIAEWPGDANDNSIAPPARLVPRDPPDLGLQLGELTAAAREQYHIPPDRNGVLVTGVIPLSPADSKGLRAGDLILTVQMQPVATPAEVTEHLAAARNVGKQYVLLFVYRREGDTAVALPLASPEPPAVARGG